VVNPNRAREERFDVDVDWAVPDLAGVLPAGVVLEHHTVSLSSRYFDTAGQDLLRHGVMLRLLTGDAENGWQLTLPDGAARTAMHAPANGNARAVPLQLREIVFGVSRGAPLRTATTLKTVRTVTRVVGPTGDVLVEINDDQLTATNAGAGAGVGAEVTRWRELDVELGAGDEQLLAGIRRQLAASGAIAARSRSKLAGLLGEQRPRYPGRRRRVRTLSDLVRGYLQAQHAALIAGDLALRRGQNAIHVTRVATRRYRSVLRVFADLFDPEQAKSLDAELAWYAGLLGAVRDGEVLGRHFAQTLSTLPAQIDVGPMSRQLDEHLAAEQDSARRSLLREMRSRRYLALLATVDAWQERPPMTEAAARPSKAVHAYLDTAGRKLGRRLKRAHRPDAADDVLHGARKAGKRVRYTAELAVPALGKPARRAVKRATKLQDTLGEHQDSTVAGDVVRKLAAATDDGQASFAYGVLYAGEHQRAQAAREHARALRWR
jgi:CHAD domain-containing protein